MTGPVPMSAAAKGAVRTKQELSERAGLVAAYREGLGLADVSVICGAAGIRIATAGHEATLIAETLEARWLCRRALDAERVATAAAAQLRRRPSKTAADVIAQACKSVVHIAQQLNVELLSEKELTDEAIIVIARMDGEIEQLRRCGGLKSVNKSYQQYRIETSARGEKILRYPEWMRKYRENLIRKLADNLRYF